MLIPTVTRRCPHKVTLQAPFKDCDESYDWCNLHDASAESGDCDECEEWDADYLERRDSWAGAIE
uniref:Uncharacterized protein n=1 Tax=viral metagenome TaxID=1070528 RepID=A0A6M3Y2T9_9ZZZZ